MTDTIKYPIGALALLLGLFLYNQSVQKSHIISGVPIYSGKNDDVYRIVISENEKDIELVRTDSSWTITQADSLLIKMKQVDKIFDRLLLVEQDLLITTKDEKWEKFGVDDSLGRHLKVYGDDDKELIHYIFGNSGQDYQHNYIRNVNSSDVYRTNDNVYFLLNTNTSYWGKNPPKPETETLDINPQ